jgi:hypothetical protein
MKTRHHSHQWTLWLPIALLARAQTGIPKPASELKKLDYFVGTWTAEGVINAGPMGAGGKFTGTNIVQWMNGAFFLLPHSESRAPWAKARKRPTWATTATTRCTPTILSTPSARLKTPKSTWDGDTWIWHSETRIGQQPTKGRLTIKVLSAKASKFKFETSPDGTT